LIEKYKDKWDWQGLSENIFLPWSIELIEKYKDKWDRIVLSIKNSLLWNVLHEKVFKPYLTNNLIDEIMQKIIENESV
jgi:hypothetical protein